MTLGTLIRRTAKHETRRRRLGPALELSLAPWLDGKMNVAHTGLENGNAGLRNGSKETSPHARWDVAGSFVHLLIFKQMSIECLLAAGHCLGPEDGAVSNRGRASRPPWVLCFSQWNNRIRKQVY